MTSRIIPIIPASGRPTEDKIQMRSITGVFTRWRSACCTIRLLHSKALSSGSSA